MHEGDRPRRRRRGTRRAVCFCWAGRLGLNIGWLSAVSWRGGWMAGCSQPCLHGLLASCLLDDCGPGRIERPVHFSPSLLPASPPRSLSQSQSQSPPPPRWTSQQLRCAGVGWGAVCKGEGRFSTGRLRAPLGTLSPCDQAAQRSDAALSWADGPPTIGALSQPGRPPASGRAPLPVCRRQRRLFHLPAPLPPTGTLHPSSPAAPCRQAS